MLDAQQALDNAITLHKQAIQNGTGNLELAKLEDYIWQCYRETDEGKHKDEYKSNYLVVLLRWANPPSNCRYRAKIFCYKWAYGLFDLWDQKKVRGRVAFDLVALVVRTAKAREQKPETLYGKLYAEITTTAEPITISWVEEKIKSAEEKKEEFAEQKTKAFTGGSYRNTTAHSRSWHFRNEVCSLFFKYIDEALNEPEMREEKIKIESEFKTELDQMMSSLFDRIHIFRKRGQMKAIATKIGPLKFRQACDAVGISHVPFGKPLPEPWLKISRTISKRAAVVHPDVNPTPAAQEAYLRLVEARDVLREYDRQRPRAKEENKNGQ